ncbi:short-chain dehydrogenase [Rhodoferax lacus]|uniref:Short-chain dehydrogenase n=1 Tax=Rhodoferax lacus TaxID=2184758 RepID=A0A3E1REK2_9BURK|nr:SDR family NAD(P)-dependent oxidoreductase [Rhodoferax lacus]RFO97462.1 short-chain dehydrogenase [Rhodoferax lacus]
MLKRVLITGGAQRLGALLCRTFAHAGWEVWCHYQHSGDVAHALVEELRSAGFAAYAVRADLRVEAQRASMLEQVVAQGGALHCLVNNASMFAEDRATGLDMDLVRSQLEVNLIAPLSLSALVAARLPPDAQAGDCSIIHVLDQKVFNLNPDYFSYTVSKLALERSVALQAQALAPRVRVCGVAPGLMFISGPQTQDNFERSGKVNLMQTALDPQRVAQSVLFLAENPCITGVTLAVDNGQHLVPLTRDVMFALADNGTPAT